MNLASKLDRLRGHSPSAADDALAARLRSIGRGPVRPSRRGAAPAVLMKAVAADSEHDGLLRRDRSHSLPTPPGSPIDLTMLPEVCELADCDWVYLDTETTGLSGGVGNLAFMVGAARYAADGSLQVRQWLLGNFAAEARMLSELLDWVGREAVLVSYNGKCFDLPLLTARLGMHRIDHGLATLPHLDLMYGVRRAYRRYWPDCRLQTAEQRLLGLQRRDDLPGSEAPAAWRAWIEEGAVQPLQGVLAHNYQDVVSLALLHHRLVGDYVGSARPAVDHAAIGRAWQAVGLVAHARRVLERAGDALDETGRLQLAGLYRRQGAWSQAEALWLDLYRRGCSAAASELSKYYEHRRRDYRKAVGFAKACDTAERGARLGRLRLKIGANLPLPW